jgi:AAA domain
MTGPGNDRLLDLVARRNLARINGNGGSENTEAGPKPVVLEELIPSPISILFSSDIPEPAQIIADGILYPGTVAVIGGASKARKTWLAIDLALSLASGTPFLAHAVPSKRRVLYLGGEGMESKLKRDLMSAVSFKPGIQNEDLEGLWTLATLGRVKIDSEAGGRWLFDWARPFEVIIIDPLYRFISHGKENSHEDQRALQDTLDRMKGQGKAVVLCHHLRKSGQEDYGAQELRGAGLDAFADSILILRRRRTPTSDRTTLHYTLRNAPEPEPLELSITEETGPLLFPAENPDRLVTVSDVVKVIREAGGRVQGRTALIEALRRTTGAKEDTAKKAIHEAESQKRIWSAKRTDDKRGRVYLLKEGEE